MDIKKMKAWTFLVSRNQLMDYKTIVAPADFIAKAQIRSLLIKATDDDFINREKVNIRRIEGSTAERFTIVFRISKVSGKEIGEEDPYLLKDSFGREIDLIEGLVIPSNPQEVSHRIRQIHFEQARQELMDKYRDFWYRNQLSDSQAIYLEENNESPIVELYELQPFILSSQKISEKSFSSTFHRRESLDKRSARKTQKRINLLIILVLSFGMSLIIWTILGNSSSSHVKITCKSLVTMQTKKIDDYREGSNYLKNLEQEYSTKNSIGNEPKIWVYLVREKSELKADSDLSSVAQSATVQSATTKASSSQPIPRMDRDSALYVDNGYASPDEAVKQLESKPNRDNISQLRIVLIEPDSFLPQCPFPPIESVS